MLSLNGLLNDYLKLFGNTKLMTYLPKLIKTTFMYEFFHNFSIVFVYKFISSILSTLIIIFMARTMGPSEYGNLSIINNISVILFMPMILGANNSMFKYLSPINREESKEFINTSIIGSTIFSIFMVIVLLGMYGNIPKRLDISVHNWRLAVLVTFALGMYSLTESFLRGMKDFSYIGKFKLTSTVINFILIVLIFNITGGVNLEHYFVCFIISYLIFIVFALKRTGIKIKILKFSWEKAKVIYSYGAINTINMTLGTILFTCDIFFVNYFYDFHAAGIYSAYQGFAKNIFSILFYEIFMVVFLPSIAQMDKNRLYKQMKKIALLLFFVTCLVIGFITFVSIILFGKEYVLKLSYIILTALSIGLYTVFNIYLNIYTMEGNNGAKMCTFPYLIVFPISILMQFYTTKYWGITGTMLSVVLTNFILIFILKLFIIRFSNKKIIK